MIRKSVRVVSQALTYVPVAPYPDGQRESALTEWMCLENQFSWLQHQWQPYGSLFLLYVICKCTDESFSSFFISVITLLLLFFNIRPLFPLPYLLQSSHPNLPSPPIPQNFLSSQCCLAVGICISFLPSLDEAFLTATALGTNPWAQQNVIRNHFTDFTFKIIAGRLMTVSAWRTLKWWQLVQEKGQQTYCACHVAVRSYREESILNSS